LNDDANKTDNNVGPLKWMAPECIRQSRYSLKSDVWAYAVTIVEILTCDVPYPMLQPLQVVGEDFFLFPFVLLFLTFSFFQKGFIGFHWSTTSYLPYRYAVVVCHRCRLLFRIRSPEATGIRMDL
jgi:serine/threonine protein kinase